MSLKKTIFFCSACTILLILSAAKCNKDKVVSKVTPVPLPTNIVPGFKFPEDSTVVNGWINNPKFSGNYDSASVYKHAWGVWAGLTANSGEIFAGDTLRVYETWLGLNEVRDQIIANNLNGGCEGVTKRYGRAALTRPKQFGHAARFTKQNAANLIAAAKGVIPPSQLFQNPVNEWVTVSYDPNAACFATKNQLFKINTINKYYNPKGLGAIPVFPNTSITIKPAYLVYDNSDIHFRLPVWSTAPNPANANFFGAANSFVFIDKSNKQPAGKKAVPVDSTESNPQKIAAATINLSEFISITVDQQMADFMNMQDSIQGLAGGGKALNGQVAVLVGMHVTTKEITNWTWQSYYWTPNRDQPGDPSSNLAASLRPTQIKGAAANYACVAAYVMLTPNNAPNNTPGAGPMFGYNPYLEGGFGPGVFTFKNTYNNNFQYGVQSNCMSCHALAIADTTTNVGQYTTDQTINLQDTLYYGKQVSLDFAWSVQTAIIYDDKVPPYWIKK
jgi:hypothetical protein